MISAHELCVLLTDCKWLLSWFVGFRADIEIWISPTKVEPQWIADKATLKEVKKDKDDEIGVTVEAESQQDMTDKQILDLEKAIKSKG